MFRIIFLFFLTSMILVDQGFASRFYCGPSSPKISKRLKEIFLKGISERVVAKDFPALMDKLLKARGRDGFIVEGQDVRMFPGKGYPYGIGNGYVNDTLEAFMSDKEILKQVAASPSLLGDYIDLDLGSGMSFLHKVKTVEQLEAFLAAGGNINHQAWFGYTPLMFAISHVDDPEVAIAMIKHPDIDINAIGGFSPSTAIGFAVYKRRIDIVQALLEHPDIDLTIVLHNTVSASSSDKITVLKQADRYDDPEGKEIAKLLKDHQSKRPIE